MHFPTPAGVSADGIPNQFGLNNEAEIPKHPPNLIDGHKAIV